MALLAVLGAVEAESNLEWERSLMDLQDAYVQSSTDGHMGVLVLFQIITLMTRQRISVLGNK